MGMNILNPLVSIYGIHQNNKNIDKQLQAQSVENQKMREHNLQLAQLQNEWNQQQWNLENAYNSPEAQMKRMKDAGLNPDMMYGGGVSGNLAASSPDLTAGAPATPMDWSALGSKKSLMDALVVDAQLEQMNAQTEKIKSETKGQDISNDIQSWEKEITDTLREEGYQGAIAFGRAAYEEYKGRLERTKFNTEMQKYNYLVDELEHEKTVRAFERELMPQQKEMFEALLREAVASANIKAFIDKMKALDFWTDKGIEAAQTIFGGIGAFGKFKLPPSEIIEMSLPGGQGKSIYKHYEK